MNQQIWSALVASADADGVLDFEAFVQTALYAPDCGYYTSQRERVGRSATADFTTASELQPVFGELVAEAAATLLERAGKDPGDYHFVEIGSEKYGGALGVAEHRFAGVETISVGGDIRLEGKCIVFSNELFDAQPFRRYVYREDNWRELGVRLDRYALTLTEVELPALADESVAIVERLLACAQAEEIAIQEGYLLDYSSGAEALLQRICGQPWEGAFIAFDYGKSLVEMLEASPQGTARAYARHEQLNDILAMPGEQDITLHVNWDGLERGLARCGFEALTLKRQEAFFLENAQLRITQIVGQASAMSDAKRSLMSLIHPSHFGHKFQVLSGLRARPRCRQ